MHFWKVNSLKLLNFDGNVFYVYDNSAKIDQIDREYIKKTLDKFLEIIEIYSTHDMSYFERRFKILKNDSKIEKIFTSIFQKDFVTNQTPTHKTISCCSIFLLFSLLLTTFFPSIVNTKLKSQIIYLARSIKNEDQVFNKFVLSIVKYFNLNTDLNIIFYKLYKNDEYKIFYYKNFTTSSLLSTSIRLNEKSL